MEGTEISPETIADYVYRNFRSHRKDRCAIFAGYDMLRPFTSHHSLDSGLLGINENYRWTGVKVSLRQKIKRIIVGDYLDWFCWYMQWRRFNAFPLVILVRPVAAMMEEEKRGFIDGLLTRLAFRSMVRRIIVFEEERFRPLVSHWLLDGPAPDKPGLAGFKPLQFREALAAYLYGSTLARNLFVAGAKRTLSYRLSRDKTDLIPAVARSISRTGTDSGRCRRRARPPSRLSSSGRVRSINCRRSSSTPIRDGGMQGPTRSGSRTSSRRSS